MASDNGAAGETMTEDPSSTVVEAPESIPEQQAAEDPSAAQWPGWPGQNVFRVVVSVTKVGSLIGKKGEIIRKMIEETGAKIRILDGVVGTTDRVVLISAREEPDAKLSPAMNAVLRVFKRANGLESDDAAASAETGLQACLVRLLVASSQAMNLIGKGGATIKGIQEESGASIRILGGDELPFYATSGERIVDIQGESEKVINALELVMGHLRKFLVDPSVIPLFDRTNTQSSSSVTQDRAADILAGLSKALLSTTSQVVNASEYPSSLNRDALLLRDPEPSADFQITRSGISVYGQDPALARTAGVLVTQVTQSMQIPLAYAEDIIGIGGTNISYIRRTSGAIISVLETRTIPDEITVEIKGSLSQVQAAQQLVQESIAGQKEPTAYSRPGYLSSFSHLGSSYLSSSLTPHSGFGSAGGFGGYGGYRY